METEKAVVEYVARDGQNIKLTPGIVKKFLVSGNAELVTTQELYLYMGVCRSRGLNPFIKDCYLIKYSSKDNAAIIVSIDYYRKRAKAQPDCEGWETGIIVQQNGNLVYREGTILMDGETLVGGWFKATPKGWKVPMRKDVPVRRYIKKTREGKVTRFWSPDNQPEQIAKVAESQGLRAAWPDEFQGLYVDAERQSEAAQKELDTSVSDAAANVAPDLEAKLGKPQSKTPEAQDDKEPGPSEYEVLPAWQRENWIKFRKAGFADFVNNNLTSFSGLPAKLRAEIISKWHGLYDEPFPEHAQTTVKTEIVENSASEKEIATNTDEPIDPEAQERDAIWDMVVDRYAVEDFEAALLTLNMAKTKPPTVDGCNALLDHLKDNYERIE